MCTLAIAFRARPDLALAITANRDELYDRPSAGPRLEGAVLAPVDLRGGGTWLGLNARGLFVGVTNRAGGSRDPSRRSRGLLVQGALQAHDARSLHAQLASLSATTYNGFHLLYADREAAFVTWSDGARVTQLALQPGVHVFTERSFGAGLTDREPLVARALEKLTDSVEGITAEALRELVRFHGPPDAPLDGACVHAPAFNYGTRSSFQLVLPAVGEPLALWTEGPPCTAPSDEITALVRTLFC